jgi:hypothetical protein
MEYRDSRFGIQYHTIPYPQRAYVDEMERIYIVLCVLFLATCLFDLMFVIAVIEDWRESGKP